MGESLYGYDDYGAGLYSRSPYVRGAAAFSTTFVLAVIPQRVKDGISPVTTAFAVSEVSEIVRSGIAAIDGVFTVSGTPEVVFNVTLAFTAVFQAIADASYTADGKAAMYLECAIIANGEAEHFWNDNTYPSNWSDTVTPDTVWHDTTAEQWNG